MEEWYAIVRENRRPQTFQAGPAQAVPQRHINRLKDTRNALLEGRPVEGLNLSEKLIRFARSFFPEISLSVIERNQLEISNCMTDRQKDLERKDGYMTYMKLDKRGVITLYMSKINEKGDENEPDIKIFEEPRQKEAHFHPTESQCRIAAD